MDENILERIKGDLLEQIISCITPLLNRQAAVIFTGGKADAAGLLKVIDGLLATKAKIVLSEGFASVMPEFKAACQDRLLADYASMQKHIAGSSLVAVPILTRNTLAKAATGVQDNLATCGIAGALMRAIPVIAVKDSCDPDGSHFRELGIDKNPAYCEMLRDHERKLASFGVKLVDSGEFSVALEAGLYGDIYSVAATAFATAGTAPAPSAAPAARRDIPSEAISAPQPASIIRLTDSFITCEDLMSIRPGTNVEIGRNAVLTPLAKEYIERRGIILTFA
ncbi:MAG: hypothetical protein LBG29_01730 [Synergistaceae bacterium]|jgi:hypothetical protein|nr:hypothetical protein [Synergistaceae bacterium]